LPINNPLIRVADDIFLCKVFINIGGLEADMAIILASASPRRKRLLGKIAKTFRVVIAKTDERMKKGESFTRACVRLAREKARAVAAKNPSAVVIGADTVAYLGKRNFRKTEDAGKARGILRTLSGKTHTVATGVAVILPGSREIAYCEKARVGMMRLSPLVIEKYLKSGEWRGRAGSYDVSGKGRALVAQVDGEIETVVGLPLKKLKMLLGSLGKRR
jgi:septum formation protein